ncbi:MAG: GAF domain-containing protein [Anaerolineae bacterium]|nr:GAF domain-containing protein [Anaerolineae bacterium]
MPESLKKLWSPPIFEDEEKSRVAYILNIVLLTMLTVVVVVGSLYLVVQIGAGVQTVFYVFVRLAGGLLLLMFLMRRGYVQFASIGLTALFLWFAYSILPAEETFSSPTPIAFILPIVMAGLLLGGRAGVLTAVISTVILALVGAGDYDTAPQLFVSLLPFFAGIYISVALLLRLAANSITDALNEARQSNTALQQINAEMESRVAERTRDLALAADIGRVLTQVRDVEQVLTEAVQNILTRFDLYYVQIYLVDTAGQNLVLRAGTGTVGRELRSRGHSLPMNAASTNGAAVVNRQAVIVADTAVSPTFRPNPLLPDTRSEMAIPLIIGEIAVGVLDLQSRQPRALSADNLGAFEILAGQLAIAIENARLLRDTSRARTELESRIQQSTRADWGGYLDAIQHGERIGYLYDRGELVPLAEVVDENGRSHAVPITLAGQEIGAIVLEETESELSPADVDIVHAVARQMGQQLENLRLLEEAERYRQEAEEATHRLVREGWATENLLAEQVTGFVYDQTTVQPLTGVGDAPTDISIPMIVQGEPIGQLELEGVADNPETIELATAVAARLSAHLENLRLTRQTEQALSEAKQRSAELNILNEMGVAFAAARETNEILTLIQTYTSRLIRPTENLYIALYDEATNETAIHLFYKPGEIVYSEKVENIIYRRSGNGVTEYVMRTRKPLLVNGDMETTAVELGFESIGARSKSWMGVPLIVGERTLGVITVQSFTTPYQYGESQMELFMSVASGAAISLESIRLLQQIQSRARQEQILREVTARVYTAVDAESILRTAAQEINQHLGLETFIYLEDEIQPDLAAANGGNGHN